MLYNATDVLRACGTRAYDAGNIYRKQGRVLSFEQDQDGIHARVHGNERHPYEQDITIAATRGQTEIDGDCTCPVGMNCKHVAAALLEGLARLTQPAKPALSDDARGSQIMTRQGSLALPQPKVAETLPPQLQTWLASLEKAEVSEQEDYPSALVNRIIYILEPMAQTGGFPKIGLKLVTARALKDGSLSSHVNNYNFDLAFSNNPAKHLRPSDMRIFRMLRSFKQDHPYGSVSALASEAGPPILAAILETGRARWLGMNSPVLQPGDSRPGTIAWQASGAEAMLPHLLAGEGLIALNATPPLYVDPVNGLVGEIDTGMVARLAATVLDAPPVPIEHLKSLNANMAQRLPKLVAVRPPEPGPPVLITGAPVPILKLLAASLPVETAGHPSYYYNYAPPHEVVGLARLSFRYGPVEIGLEETRNVLTRVRDNQLLEVHRDARREKKAMSGLLKHDFAPAPQRRKGVPKPHERDFLPEGGEIAWFDVLYRILPDLRAEGFEIHIADDFPIRLLRGDGDVDADIHEGSGIDWLELGVGVMVDGQRIDLIGPIVDIIMRGVYDPEAFQVQDGNDDPFYLPLGGGQYIALSPARFAPIINAIYELASGGATTLKNGKLRLARADAAGIGEFEAATLDAGVIWRGGERIRDMGRKLKATGGIPPVELPATFTANLRPYQAQGVAWLAFLRDVGLGGILADDMGLGKTVQALALIAIEKAAGRLDVPALVVAPTSLMANWRREAEKFAPDLRVLTLHGSDRKNHFDEIPAHDLVLTTYPLVGRDQEALAGRPWHLLFLDEAQTIKNPNAATTQFIINLDARHRFCLTGTPLENHLGELWSLFAFASPGFLGDQKSFKQIWRTPIEKRGDSERGRLLAKRVKPFMLRRTKAEVASDLPPKTEIVERIDMEPAQRDIYESIRLSMHAKVQAAIAAKGFARSRIVILDALLKLRQTCCDPRLLKLTGKSSAKAGSAKLERLLDMLEELIEEGRKIIVFSQFTSMLELIRPQLDKMGTPYALLTGQTKDREAQLRRFQASNVPVFLISLKAGGTGLNLTEADTVILYDPWWNPAVEEQAIDRAHRIGQDKPVFVHKLVINGTIEEKMEVLKEKKRALAQSIFDSDGTPTLAMTESDLDMLFAAA